MTVVAAQINELALSIFCVIIAITFAITYWASKRTRTATDFWAAGRGISGGQNGFAITGDYVSAASFLGVTGLIFLYGFDGVIYMVGFLVAFLTVILLLAERMRNAGKYTIADVLAFRLRERPARTAAALSTLVVGAFYVMVQMVAAGTLIPALIGIDYTLSVVLAGVLMLVYVIFGGMIATTWLQIIKAVLLLSAASLLSLLVLVKVGFNPIELFERARDQSPNGQSYLEPGLYLTSPLDLISLALALVLGVAGLPHVLVRFFTVRDAKAARSSVGWAVALIGAFYIMTTIMGFGARALLGSGAEQAAGPGANLAGPLLAEQLGGGAGSLGGDLFLAFVAAVAFATILAVVAGLIISASGAVAHDLWSSVARHGEASEAEEVRVARLAAVGLGVAAILGAILAEGQNISFLVGLVFALAASANFPTLLLALTWRRFNTAGAVTGVAVGVLSSLLLIIISPVVWPGPDGGALSFWTLSNPGIVSIPLGFLGCWLGTLLSSDQTSELRFDELRVRSETGLGSEQAAAAVH